MKPSLKDRQKIADELILRISKCKLKENGYWCCYDVPEDLMEEARKYVKIYSVKK